MKAQGSQESARQHGSRRRPARLAGVAIIVAVGAGAVAFVITQSSSAQTTTKPAVSPLSSADGSPAPKGARAAARSVSPVKEVNRASYGAILVTDSGATLYHYTPDKPNTPTCTGSCAVAWPPDLLPAGSTSVPSSGLTGLGSVMSSDGLRQLTYDKMPLYTFADDHGTSVNGQGIGGVWFVVHPSSAPHTATRSVAPTAPVANTTSGGGYGY